MELEPAGGGPLPLAAAQARRRGDRRGEETRRAGGEDRGRGRRMEVEAEADEASAAAAAA